MGTTGVRNLEGNVLVPRWLVVSLIILVGVAWGINIALEMFTNHPSNPQINGIFATVLGFVFMIYRAETRKVTRRRQPPKKVTRGDGTE